MTNSVLVHFRLEETNRRLREEVQEKDEDLLLLQDEIQQLTERINMMNKEQSRQIGMCNGLVICKKYLVKT